MSEGRTSPAPSDGDLLFRLSRGDEPAYRMLHDRHQAPVFRVAVLLTRTTSDAEEVAATAFFELWRRRDAVRLIDGSVLPWLLATTSSAANDGLRPRRRYRRLLHGLPLGEGSDHADEVARAMGALGITEDLHRLLLTLRRRDARIAVLCLVHGLAPADAAIVLGIPVSTVAARLSRVGARHRGSAPEYSPRAKEANA